MTPRYVTGPAYAVVRGGALVLLPERVTPELVDELWSVLENRAGVLPVLEVLTGSFGASLASLPPFAIAVVDGRRVQVAVRGGTAVAVALTDGREHVAGDGVTTWMERTFDDVVDLSVQVGVSEPTADLVDARALPLDSGVALVASIGVRLTHDADSAAVADRPGPASDSWDAEPEQEPEAGAEAEAGTERDGAPGSAPERAFPPEATMAPESPTEPSDAFGETTGFGHLWGSTVLRGVEAAAVRPAEDETDGEPEHIARADETGPSDADEIDGSTVLSSAIADLRATVSEPAVEPSGAAPGPATRAPAPDVGAPPPGPSFAAAPVPGRPAILARSCTAGHPNPPQRDTCGLCGLELAGEARQVDRPPLGVMSVSGGSRVTLDRPVVVGRRPRSPRSAGEDLPRLVTVPSPQQDISRSHVEVRLEGWHVLVGDLDTTNGTTLLRAGQRPLRLHPGEPVLAVSGDVVDLGDGVTLTFEGIL